MMQLPARHYVWCVPNREATLHPESPGPHQPVSTHARLPRLGTETGDVALAALV